jgi:hypothetical protein
VYAPATIAASTQLVDAPAAHPMHQGRTHLEVHPSPITDLPRYNLVSPPQKCYLPFPLKAYDCGGRPSTNKEKAWQQGTWTPQTSALLQGGGINMSALPVLLIVWAVFAACFLALLAYKGQLTRYEDDQLFLSDNLPHEQQIQTEIVRKVNKIAPFVRVFGVAAAVMTAGIVGIFTYDAWQHLK